MKLDKKTGFSLAAGVLIISGLLYWLFLEKTSLEYYGEFPNTELQTIEGETYSFKESTDKVRLVEFLFLNCPDVCPTTTVKMQWLQEKLKEEGLFGDKVEFIMITFDPERDTVERLEEYAKNMNLDRSGWVIIRDEEEKIKEVTGALNYFVQEQGDFIIHTTKTYLVDEEGNIRAQLGMGEDFNEEEALKQIKTLLR
jgi:protein SCO1